LIIPDEHLSHEPAIHEQATWIASATALSGFLMATVFYGWRLLSADDVRRQFAPVYTFLINKWYFDELYNVLFVQPVFVVSSWASWIDRNVLDRLIDLLARGTIYLAKLDDTIDRAGIDYLVNLMANVTYSLGLSLRRVQTGQIRTYVMSIVLGTVVLFVVISFALNYALAR
jgi:NADH-quinone oxidoreductase subunit L